MAINVNAQTTKFYEAEYIDNIYISKYQYSNNTIYYQKARLFREVNTNEVAYCIEPFVFFNENSTYESSIDINSLSKEKMDTIKRIAYYGYGYKNHYEIKWYAITQFMIWQETVNNGEIFFTDKLNGKRIYPYQNEINEIYTLVNNSKLTPSFTNNTYTLVEDNELILEDTNNVLYEYKTNDYTINDNKITINNLKEGSHTIKLYKNYTNYNTPHIFYQSYNSQNLIKLGNIEEEIISLNFNVIKTNIEINKIDKDTKTSIPQGEASLDNAIIGLYDENMNLINEYTIINNKIVIKNINIGKYYIKEIKAGEGYTLNNNIYEINIKKDNYNQKIDIENEVIKKNIIIEKKYGEENNLNYEKDIHFEIYDKNNNLISTIKTNEKGIAKITLPYGTYTFKQLNTTTGYQKIEPFEIKIINTEDEIIELTDYKIPVPNTHKNNIFYTLLLIIINLLI